MSDSSLNVYANNVLRVAKIAGLDAIPKSATWLDNDKLRTKIGKIETKIRRHLLTAVVVGLGAYGRERTGEWGKMLAKASEDYTRIRDNRKLSELEKSKWPKNGHKALKKILTALKPKAERFMTYENPSKSDLFAVQKYLIFVLYDANPWRNDPASFEIGPGDSGNRIYKPRGSRNWKVLMRNHKTSKSLGEVVIDFTTTVSRKLSKIIPFLQKHRTNKKNLLLTHKGIPMSRSALSKLLLRTSDNIIGKKFGSRQLRVMFASSPEAIKVREAAEKQARNMLHSEKMHKTYSKI